MGTSTHYKMEEFTTLLTTPKQPTGFVHQSEKIKPEFIPSLNINQPQEIVLI